MSVENRIKKFLDEEGFVARTKGEVDNLFKQHGGEEFLDYINWFFCPESQARNINHYYERAAQIIGEQCVYDLFVSRYREVKELILKRILENADSQSARILDVGCGTGLDTNLFAWINPGNSVVGLDFSSSMLRRALRRTQKRKLRNVNYILGDRDNLPFQNNSFDMYVCLNGFTEGDNFYGRDVEMMARFAYGKRLDDAFRVLKPHGRIFLSLPTWNVEDVGEGYMEFERENWEALLGYSEFADVSGSHIRVTSGMNNPHTCLFVSGRKE